MKKLLIILAEDDPIISWGLLRQLNKLKLENIQVVDSSLWIEERNANLPVDLVITNLKLSDGWVTDNYLEAISKLGCGVLVITGLGDNLSYNLSRFRIPFAQLIKPFNIVQIKQCIFNFLLDKSADSL